MLQMISVVWWLLGQLLDRFYMMMYNHWHGFFGSNVLLVSKSQFSNIIGIDWLVTFGLLAAAIMALVAVDKIVLKLMK
jgi:hypothetical protein